MDKTNNLFLSRNLDLFIGNALKKPIFSACSLGFYKSEHGKISREIFNYGRTGLGCDKKLVCEKSFFDLASLTKPLVTSLVFLFLVENGIIKFGDNLARFFSGVDSDKKLIKMHHLLTHTSGLPAHRPYFKELVKLPVVLRWKFVIEKILSEKLVFFPGKSCLYSDLGFILLGCIIERVTGEPLDIFWKKNILQPMNIENELFFPNTIHSEEISFVETGRCPWSNINLKGVVNDDNCRILGGVAGHAGLFGTISGVLKFIEKLTSEIQGKTSILHFSTKTLQTFLKRKKNTPWINGFDTPSTGCSSSGDYFSDVSFGHLGFTGTSFWMDIKLGCGVVMLTNRVLCGDDLNSIRKLRPLIHNLVMSYIIQQ